MLPPGPAPEHLAMASSLASGGSCSGLDPYVGSYIRTVKIVQGILVVTSILQPLVGASSSSTSVSTLDLDSCDDYPEIGASACGEPVEGSRPLCMVAPDGDRSNNTSNRYPTIDRSEASDARTPGGGMVRNLNPDFNAIWVQAIMDTIQRMAPDGSPLAVISKGLRWQTLSSQTSRLAFPGGNLPSMTTIGHGVPEVKLHHQQVQITICPRMMHGGASLRTAPRGNVIVNGMTFAALSKIGGVSGLEFRPHHDSL
jgi:hypothetical protein